MKLHRAFLLSCLLSLLPLLASCNGVGSGFTVSTKAVIGDEYVGIPVNLPAINVSGNIVPGTQGPGATGTAYDYYGETDTKGLYDVPNAVTPAYWNHIAEIPHWMGCNVSSSATMIYSDSEFDEWETPEVDMEAGDFQFWLCYVPPGDLPLTTSRFALSGSIPSSVTLNGYSSFSMSGGTPQLYLYSGSNATPSLIATEAASSVASDGSSATFPLPSSLSPGGYAFVAESTDASGHYNPISLSMFAVASTQSVSGAPFGVSVAGVTDSYSDRDTCDRTSSGSTSYSTFPVVSQYSGNEVRIGSAEVAVGENPTAIVAYPGPQVGQSWTDGCDSYRDDYTGDTRAVVANSGTSSISILDLINNDVLSTVQVGNHPDAIAVSSDGSTAYVANYSDGTITSVALSTATVGSTIGVGGDPTSLALTSSGTLWVGGNNFLTDVNTQNMTVVSTISTGGKSLVALGYSDEVNQLSVTAIENNNVYVDQINPSTIMSSGYQPVASTQVSSLGTHFDSHTQAYISSFTNTLASSPALNPDIPGAGPLVVHDGWAVISAMPTGFSVSDLDSKKVLFSVTTPSPVTAIAVDTTLNAAYVALPDSNLIYSVPLPGTTTTLASGNTTSLLPSNGS
jgi:DNA-binding beta-propeller fold protein YncE